MAGNEAERQDQFLWRHVPAGEGYEWIRQVDVDKDVYDVIQVRPIGDQSDEFDPKRLEGRYADHDSCYVARAQVDISDRMEAGNPGGVDKVALALKAFDEMGYDETAHPEYGCDYESALEASKDVARLVANTGAEMFEDQVLPRSTWQKVAGRYPLLRDERKIYITELAEDQEGRYVSGLVSAFPGGENCAIDYDRDTGDFDLYVNEGGYSSPAPESFTEQGMLEKISAAMEDAVIELDVEKDEGNYR